MTSREGWPKTPDELAEQVAVVDDDMDLKRRRGDMHGVSDCANDIRELQAYFEGYQRGYIDGTKHAVEQLEAKVKRRAG